MDDARQAEHDLAAWDAEIEADFQRVVGATKVAGQRKRGRRHVGFPLEFLIDVCRLTEGRTALVVAEIIYRRTHVCRSPAVTLPTAELAGLGITRRQKKQGAGPTAHSGADSDREHASGTIGQGDSGLAAGLSGSWKTHHRVLEDPPPGPGGPSGSLSTLTLSFSQNRFYGW